MLLLRHPGSFLALSMAGLLLALVTASGPLYLASAGSSAVGNGIARAGPAVAGLTVRSSGPLSADRIRYRSALLDAAVHRIDGLRPAVAFAAGSDALSVENVIPARTIGRPVAVAATRTDFVRNLTILSRAPGRGWWMARSIAALAQVRAGDQVRVSILRNDGSPIPLGRIRVVGIYRDLSGLPESSYWYPVHRFILPAHRGDPLPPPLLLADQQAFFRLVSNVAADGFVQWEYWTEKPTYPPEQAELMADGIRRFGAQLADPSSAIGIGFGSSYSGFPDIAAAGSRTAQVLSGPIQSLVVAIQVVVLLLLVAAGLYAVNRRRAEFASLYSRGMGAPQLGLKLALESLTPLLAGGLVGWRLALAGVQTFGPSTMTGRAALRVAALVSASSLGVGILTLVAGVTVALWAAEPRRPGMVSIMARRIPWEAPVFVLALAALYEVLRKPPASLASLQAIPSVDAFLPLFPILFLVGAGGAAARILGRLVLRIRRGGSHGPIWIYLATRRLAAARRIVTMLLTASVVAVGIFAYASALAASVRTTAHDKALVFVGSDEAISVTAREPLPLSVADRATRVVRLLEATAVRGGEPLEVLAIDSRTFLRGAFWDPHFSSLAIDRLLAMLRGPGVGPIPALVVGPGPEGAFNLNLAGVSFGFRAAGSADAFPGMEGNRTLMVVDAETLERSLAGRDRGFDDLRPTYQVWVHGGAKGVLAALRARGIIPDHVDSASAIEGSPAFAALLLTFRFQRGLGLLGVLVVLAGVLLYLQARQLSVSLSYALTRRMGLSARAHRRSVAFELAGMLGVAFMIGAGLAMAGAALVYRRTDLLPQLPPRAALWVPTSTLAWLAATLFVLAWTAAWSAHLRAERANIAEVMRLAG